MLARILFLIVATLNKLTRTIAVVIIIAATFLVYRPALRNGFVWDDTALVLRDPLIRSWHLIPESFRHFLFLDATASNFYRPLQRLSFIADYQLYGFDYPAGWHFTSIVIHAGAAVALFFFAEKLLAGTASTRLAEPARRAIAAGVALAWAIHPLHTSAVTYISGRADSLAALFGFTGLALGLAATEPRRRRWIWISGAAACFAAAMLSKESGIAFLLIWLLVMLWRRETWRTFATWLATFAIIIGGYCALRFTAEKIAPPPAPAVPVEVRPILAARAFAQYAGLIVAPVTLRMERDVSTTPRDTIEATFQNARALEYLTLAGVLLLIGFAAWTRHCIRRAPEAALCIGAFGIAYAPISNLFSLNATIAEHWLYVPSAFLFLAVPASGTCVRNRRARIAAGAVIAAWIALLGARTCARQEDWRDQRTFIERTIAAGGNSPRMYMNLANVESNAGNQDRALALYREALTRAPKQPVIWLGFASVLARAHDFHGAREALMRAGDSPLLRAQSLLLTASLDQAEGIGDGAAAPRDAARAEPAGWLIRKRCIEQLSREHALEALSAFIAAHDFRAESWRMYGALLEQSGRASEAIDAYRHAALRDVRDGESRASIARLRAN